MPTSITGTIDSVSAEEEGMLGRELTIGIGRDAISCECVGRGGLREGEGEGEEECDRVERHLKVKNLWFFKVNVEFKIRSDDQFL